MAAVEEVVERGAACADERLGAGPASAFLPLRCSITSSRRLSRERTSSSAGRLDLREACRESGKTHSTPDLMQFEHGDCLLHRTFLRRQVTQLHALADSTTAGRAIVAGLGGGFGEISLAVGEEFSSGELSRSDMTDGWSVRLSP